VRELAAFVCLRVVLFILALRHAFKADEAALPSLHDREPAQQQSEAYEGDEGVDAVVRRNCRKAVRRGDERALRETGEDGEDGGTYLPVCDVKIEDRTSATEKTSSAVERTNLIIVTGLTMFLLEESKDSSGRYTTPSALIRRKRRDGAQPSAPTDDQ